MSETINYVKIEVYPDDMYLQGSYERFLNVTVKTNRAEYNLKQMILENDFKSRLEIIMEFITEELKRQIND